MQPLPRIAILATTAAVFFGLVELSLAGLDETDRSNFQTTSFSPQSEPVPAPITGDRLTASVRSEDEATRDVCMNADDVMATFLLDIENVGGEIVILTDGAQQEFADSWRGLIAETRVEVTLVMAHLIPDPNGNPPKGSPIVDLVEIDSRGCMYSRTLLTESDWLALINLALSVEA